MLKKMSENMPKKMSENMPENMSKSWPDSGLMYLTLISGRLIFGLCRMMITDVCQDGLIAFTNFLKMSRLEQYKLVTTYDKKKCR